MDSPAQPIISHQEPFKEPQIYWRNLFHIVVGSSIPIIGMLSNSKTMVVFLSIASVLIITLECLRFRYDTLNVSFVCVVAPILKRKEIKTVTGATYMLISSLVCFLLFDKEIAIAALLFLSVGDPFAAWFGRKTAVLRLGDKSLFGTVAMFLASVSISAILWISPINASLGLLVLGSATAAITEVLPLGLDDNLTIPIVSGSVMTLLIL